MAKYILRLYITGGTPSSANSLKKLKQVLDEQPNTKDNYKLEVIDVLRRPQLAEDERIVSTPTLLKKLPPPARRVLGELSDRQKILLGLDLVKQWEKKK